MSAAPADDAAVLAELARLDLRVATVGYRLLTAAPPLCAERSPQAGLLVQDVQQFPPALRSAATRAFGFSGWPAVEAVVPGAPAERAGLVAGDAIVAVDGQQVAPRSLTPDRRRPSFAPVEALQARLAAAYARGSATLTVERGGVRREVRVQPVSGCAQTVQVDPGTSRDAWSDGRGVAITSALVQEAASDDELAAVIGHEVAHNLLHHRDRLHAAGIGKGLFSRVGTKAAKVRATEEEADRVGLYLAARAGYDPAAGAAFWERYGHAHGDGFLTDATHPGWRARVAALAATAVEIARKRAAGAPLAP